jgi:hypothetical protein
MGHSPYSFIAYFISYPTLLGIINREKTYFRLLLQKKGFMKEVYITGLSSICPIINNEWRKS